MIAEVVRSIGAEPVLLMGDLNNVLVSAQPHLDQEQIVATMRGLAQLVDARLRLCLGSCTRR